MRRSFHLVRPQIGQRDLVVASFDTYEQASEAGKRALQGAPSNTVYQINQGGRIVWGPYIVGGSYTP